MNVIKILFLFIIIIFIIICLFKYCENIKDQNIKILNKNELYNILLNENDYYNTFTNLDLQVRNVSSIEEYKTIIKDSPVTINKNEELIIINTINNINNKIKNYNTIGLNGNKFNNIKWIIGIIDGTIYEGGYPHTRNNIIIIPKNLINNFELMQILIHEKIHVYQKTYSDDIKLYLNKNDFKIYKINDHNNNYRANPDTDNYIYTDKNNNLMYCLYNNNPNNITDVTLNNTNNFMYEHPFEYMAYTLQDEIINLKTI
jgi:hypothetical protein